MSQCYFAGIKGLIRLVRTLYESPQGAEPFNQKVLNEKIFIALSACPYYDCCGNDQIMKNQLKYINDVICNLKRPHPYKNVFFIIKDSLIDYGSLLEKDFSKFEAQHRFEKDTGEKNNPDNKAKIKVSRLLEKIKMTSNQMQTKRSKEYANRKIWRPSDSSL